MTRLLARAVAEAEKLSAEDQDAMAAQWLAELESERQWEQAFAATPSQLAKLAEEAIAEFKAGETRPMDLDRDFPHD